MLNLRKDTIARIYHRYLPLAIIYFLYLFLVNPIIFMSFVSHKQKVLDVLENNSYHLARDIGQFFHDAADKKNPIDITPVLNNSRVSSEVISVSLSNAKGVDTLHENPTADASEIITKYILFTSEYPHYLVTPDRPILNGIDKRNFQSDYLMLHISSKSTNHNIDHIFMWHVLCLSLFAFFPIMIVLYFNSAALAKKMGSSTKRSPSNSKIKQEIQGHCTSENQSDVSCDMGNSISVIQKVLFTLMDTPINTLQRSYLRNVFHILEDVEQRLNASVEQTYQEEAPNYSNDTKVIPPNLSRSPSDSALLE